MSIAATTKRFHLREERRQPLDVGLFHLVWLFLLVSFIGLVGETVVSAILDGRWESRAGFIVGPFSPLYGLGAVLITLALNPLRDRGVPLQFLVAGLVGGVLEYFAGWFFETRYGIVAWSYIDQPLNFHGHTCVAMMAVWGMVGIVWSLWLLPAGVRLVERIPQNVRKPLTAFALVFIVADSALTLACLDSWFWRTAGYPVEGPIQQFCAAFFGDDVMKTRFETMSMWTVLASR